MGIVRGDSIYCCIWYWLMWTWKGMPTWKVMMAFDRRRRIYSNIGVGTVFYVIYLFIYHLEGRAKRSTHTSISISKL